MQRGKKAYDRHIKMFQCTARTMSMEHAKSVFTGICRLYKCLCPKTLRHTHTLFWVKNDFISNKLMLQIGAHYLRRIWKLICKRTQKYKQLTQPHIFGFVTSELKAPATFNTAFNCSDLYLQLPLSTFRHSSLFCSLSLKKWLRNVLLEGLY